MFGSLVLILLYLSLQTLEIRLRIYLCFQYTIISFSLSAPLNLVLYIVGLGSWQ